METPVILFEDYFDGDALFVLDEPAHIAEKGETTALEFRESMTGRLEKGYILPAQADVIFDYKELLAKMVGRNTVTLSTLEAKLPYMNSLVKYDLTAKSIVGYNNNFELLIKDLTTWKKSGYRVILLSASRTRAVRLADDLRERELTAFYTDNTDRVVQKGEILVGYGSVHRGFEYPLIKFVMISESDIFGAEKKKKKRPHLRILYLDKKNVSIYENQVLTYPVIYTIKNDGSIVYEPYTAQKRTSTNVRLTMMDISPASIELGTISKNGVYKDSVKITNIGKDTLFIEDIQSSCECTQVDWKKEPIAPSETVWLYITFRPDMIGEFERYVTVYSNVKQSPIEIPIKGTIK